MNTNEIPRIYNSIQQKLNDKTWCEAQDADFIKDLQQVQDMVQTMSSQIYIFVDLFQQYVASMYSSPIFSTKSAEDTQDGKDNPTQTSSASQE